MSKANGQIMYSQGVIILRHSKILSEPGLNTILWGLIEFH